MQIPAGRLSELFGGKWIIAFGLLGSGVVNILTPLAASSVILITASRVLLGVVQGGIYAACFSMVYQWMPYRERSTGYGLVNAGSAFGVIIASPLSGYLSDSVYFGGWPSSFYAAGLIGIISFIFFAPLVKSYPHLHPWVTKEELLVITKDTSLEDAEESRKMSVPWRRMFTSPAVLATMFAKMSCCLFWVKIPDYFSNVLHVSMTANGIYNCIFSVASIITVCMSGYLSEMLIDSKLLSKTNTRKFFGSLGTYL